MGKNKKRDWPGGREGGGGKHKNYRQTKFDFRSFNIFALSSVSRVQCDQVGRFLKVLVNKLVDKSSLKRLVTFGLF